MAKAPLQPAATAAPAPVPVTSSTLVETVWQMGNGRDDNSPLFSTVEKDAGSPAMSPPEPIPVAASVPITPTPLLPPLPPGGRILDDLENAPTAREPALNPWRPQRRSGSSTDQEPPATVRRREPALAEADPLSLLDLLVMTEKELGTQIQAAVDTNVRPAGEATGASAAPLALAASPGWEYEPYEGLDTPPVSTAGAAMLVDEDEVAIGAMAGALVDEDPTEEDVREWKPIVPRRDISNTWCNNDPWNPDGGGLVAPVAVAAALVHLLHQMGVPDIDPVTGDPIVPIATVKEAMRSFQANRLSWNAAEDAVARFSRKVIGTLFLRMGLPDEDKDASKAAWTALLGWGSVSEDEQHVVKAYLDTEPSQEALRDPRTAGSLSKLVGPLTGRRSGSAFAPFVRQPVRIWFNTNEDIEGLQTTRMENLTMATVRRLLVAGQRPPLRLARNILARFVRLKQSTEKSSELTLSLTAKNDGANNIAYNLSSVYLALRSTIFLVPPLGRKGPKGDARTADAFTAAEELFPSEVRDEARALWPLVSSVLFLSHNSKRHTLTFLLRDFNRVVLRVSQSAAETMAWATLLKNHSFPIRTDLPFTETTTGRSRAKTRRLGVDLSLAHLFAGTVAEALVRHVAPSVLPRPDNFVAGDRYDPLQAYQSYYYVPGETAPTAATLRRWDQVLFFGHVLRRICYDSMVPGPPLTVVPRTEGKRQAYGQRLFEADPPQEEPPPEEDED
jgi:hypothetical protein